MILHHLVTAFSLAHVGSTDPALTRKGQIVMMAIRHQIWLACGKKAPTSAEIILACEDREGGWNGEEDTLG